MATRLRAVGASVDKRPLVGVARLARSWASGCAARWLNQYVSIPAGYQHRWVALRGVAETATDQHGPAVFVLYLREMDTLAPVQRSERMSRVKSKDTKPELAVRQILSRLGFRYRLHDSALPGSPDIVFRRREKIVFVHG